MMNVVAVAVVLVLLVCVAVLFRPAPRAKRFRCPKCGSTSWGSVPPFTEGECAECSFRWLRENDAMYFHEP
jgi:hypothetical protein